jgi:NADH-quinone oxidoreductase subunit H
MSWMLGLDLTAYWATTTLKVLVVLSLIPAGAIILGYVFLLKMMSWMQSRMGPMEAGPRGSLQLVADGVKFMQKEDIFPARADRFVFAAAPIVVLMSTFLLYIVIPAGPRLIVEDLDTGIFFALAVSSLSVLGILMAGWSSRNRG